MFSKATLIGVVGVDPKYKSSTNGKKSVVAFRVGCEVLTTSKKITEWYSVKAFGSVADYLIQHIKKGSNVYLEASIRSRRWMVGGVERQGMEFHAFVGRVISEIDSNADLHSQKETLSAPADGCQTLALPFPEEECMVTDPSNKPIEPVKPKKPIQPPSPEPKELTPDQARQAYMRFRHILDGHKKRIAELANAAPVTDKVAPTTLRKATASSVQPPAESNARNPFNSQCKSVSDVEFPSTGNTTTDALINARKALISRTDNTLNEMKGYAHIRGDW